MYLRTAKATQASTLVGTRLQVKGSLCLEPVDQVQPVKAALFASHGSTELPLIPACLDRLDGHTYPAQPSAKLPCGSPAKARPGPRIQLSLWGLEKQGQDRQSDAVISLPDLSGACACSSPALHVSWQGQFVFGTRFSPRELTASKKTAQLSWTRFGRVLATRQLWHALHNTALGKVSCTADPTGRFDGGAHLSAAF